MINKTEIKMNCGIVMVVVLLSLGITVNGMAMTVCESGRINTAFCQEQGSMDTCFNLPKTITFKNNFLMEPAVTSGLAKLNSDTSKNTRVNTLLTITQTTLTVQFNCMIDSHCYSASVQYMACGFVDVEKWNAEFTANQQNYDAN